MLLVALRFCDGIEFGTRVICGPTLIAEIPSGADRQYHCSRGGMMFRAKEATSPGTDGESIFLSTCFQR